MCCPWSTDDIEIIFRRGSWKASGEFAQTDVHRQIAIVFKTPPYQDQDITEEVEVSVALRRLSDQMESEPISFTYLPHNPGESGVRRTDRLLMADEVVRIYFYWQIILKPETIAGDQFKCFCFHFRSIWGEAEKEDKTRHQFQRQTLCYRWGSYVAIPSLCFLHVFWYLEAFRW